LKKLIKKVENEESMLNILKYAVEFSRADADINPRENEILKFMSKEWGISLNTFMDEE
jgi:hypothetical protein